MVDKPDLKSLEGFVLYEGVEEPLLIKKTVKAWERFIVKEEWRWVRRIASPRKLTPVGSRAELVRFCCHSRPNCP